MNNLLVAGAILMLLIGHYAFSFQRFTLQIARSCQAPGLHIYEVQILMTPAWMGALGWVLTFGHLIVAGLVWYSISWFYALAYLIINYVIGGIVPLFPFVNQFSRLSLSELQRNAAKPQSDDAARTFLYFLEAEIKSVR